MFQHQIIRLLLLLTVMAGASCNSCQELKPIQKPSKPDQKLRQLPDKAIAEVADCDSPCRFAIRDRWFADLAWLEQKTADEGLSQLAGWLQRSHISAILTATSIKAAGRFTNDEQFFFITLTKGDLATLVNKPLVKMFVAKKGRILGRYDYESRSLLVPDTIPVSQPFRALVLAHEGMHAWRFLTGRVDYSAQHPRVIEEVQILYFQNRLLPKLGGKHYQQVFQPHRDQMRQQVESELQRLRGRKDFSANRDQYVAIFCHNYIWSRNQKSGDYDRQLDQAFGKSQSARESYIRQQTMYRHVAFAVIDHLVPAGNRFQVHQWFYMAHMDIKLPFQEQE